MRSTLRRGAAGMPRTCIVCLPGAFHGAADLQTAGFHDSVLHRGLAIDLQFVDLELRHLGDRQPVHDLHRHLVAPARTSGYGNIWLAGISLGGYIALDCAASHPGSVDGICLLAPYLGNRMLIREIAAAPALSAWYSGPLADDDAERRIWRYIQGLQPNPSGTTVPELHLGFGREDRFAAAQRLLADALPARAVDAVAGGHDWPTWRRLWERFLDSSRFA